MHKYIIPSTMGTAHFLPSSSHIACAFPKIFQCVWFFDTMMQETTRLFTKLKRVATVSKYAHSIVNRLIRW